MIVSGLAVGVSNLLFFAGLLVSLVCLGIALRFYRRERQEFPEGPPPLSEPEADKGEEETSPPRRRKSKPRGPS